MSKDYWGFSNEKPETAFLCGMADVLSDKLSMILDLGYSFESDVFEFDQNDVSVFENSIKKRFKSFNKTLVRPVAEHDINQIKSKLEYTQDDIRMYLYECVKPYSKSPVLKERIDEFCNDMDWYLGSPEKIFRFDDSLKLNSLFSEYYLGIIFDIFFILYDGFAVMIVIGSSD